MSSPPSDRPFKEYQKTSSSAAGCFIFITIAAVVIFLLAWAAYTFYTQNKAIDEFTVATPLQIEHPAPTPERTAGLNDRLRAYAAQPPTSLSLTVDDLNLIIASEERLADLRTTFRFDSMADGQISATVSFPLRNLGSTDFRYLNGTMSFIPKVVEGQFVMDLQAITVPGKEVAPGFVGNYRHSRYLENLFFRPFEDDRTLWPVIATTTSAKVVGDKVELERSPPPAQP